MDPRPEIKIALRVETKTTENYIFSAVKFRRKEK